MTKEEMKANDSRYPYTYAADYIRQHASRDDGTTFSRSEAAQIHAIVADAFGIDRAELAKKLADKYIDENIQDYQ